MQPSPVLVRTARTADFDAWLPLWQAYNEFYGRSGETALPRQTIDSTWSRFFDADEPVQALVAESGGELLGIAHYLFHRSTIHIAPICYLQDLFTAPAARGRGIGRALIEAVHERAATAGSGRFYWHTRQDNATAMRLYDQLAERQPVVMYVKPL